jgi:hypothetical protein
VDGALAISEVLSMMIDDSLNPCEEGNDSIDVK